MGGDNFRSGNIKLFHYGKDLVLGAQIYLTDEAHSLSFEEKLSEVGKFNSQRQEAVWWMPSNDTSAKVVLTNTGDFTLSVSAILAKKPNHSGNPRVLTLAPHSTRVFELGDEFTDARPFLNSDVVSLTFEHSGEPGALLPRLMLSERSRGYSNIVQFSNPSGGKSNRYEGVSFQIEDVQGQHYQPVIVARNLGESDTTVSANVPYTRGDGTQGNITLAAEQLSPGEMRALNVQSIIHRASQEAIAIASLEIQYSSSPGSVIVAAQSYSEDHNQVFRVPMWDPLSQRSPTGGYPWRIEGTSVTETYIKNISDMEENYVAFLILDHGGQYMIGQKSIGPHETIHIDVKKLRDEQIPDQNGNTIPPNATAGQIQWTLNRIDVLPSDDERANLSLIGRSEQVDLARGTVNNYSCQNCCAGNHIDGYITPNSLQIEYGETAHFAATEVQETCYGYPYVYTVTANWNSSNSGMGPITGGTITPQTAGASVVTGSWWVQDVHSGPCIPFKPEFGVPGTVEETDCENASKEITRRQVSGPSFPDSPGDPGCGCQVFPFLNSINAQLIVKPRVRILRDGQDITSDAQNAHTQTVITGQRMNLTALITGGSPNSMQWTIPDKIVKDFQTMPAGRTPTSGATIPVSGLNTNMTDFVWYDGSFTGIPKQISFVASVNGIAGTAMANFVVKKPTATFTTTRTGTTQVGYLPPPASGQGVIYLGDPPGGASGGMRFSRGTTLIPKDFSGTFQFVQTVSGTVTSTVNHVPHPFYQSGLDGCYPYTLDTTMMEDTPSSHLVAFIPPVIVDLLDYNSQWTAYLMFRPDGLGSVWVPLKKIDWSWHAQAVYVPNSNPSLWTPNGIAEPGVPASTDTTIYPTWTSITGDLSGCTTLE